MSKSFSGRHGRNVADSISEARELYFDAIGMEAISRAGNCPQLKGHIHELLFRDKLNFGSNGLVKGNVTRLTKDPFAPGADLVTVNSDGSVSARYQLKDCTSKSGIEKTLRQTRDGKYRNTRLMGTKETRKAYDNARQPVDKRMESTGISSKRTGRIADNSSVNCRDGNTFWNNMGDVASCSGTSALFGAASGSLSSIFSNYERFNSGEIDGVDYAVEVTCDTVKGAGGAAMTTAAALTLKEGGKALGKSVGSETLKRMAGSNVGTAVAFGAVEEIKDVFDFCRGEIDGHELGRRTVATTAATGGSLGGAGAGAALGTMICPGVGTAVGALVGAIGGGLGGRSLGEALSDLFFD